MHRFKLGGIPHFVEPLEPRCLLSFNPLGGATTVVQPVSGDVQFTDIAVAENGNYMVVSQVFLPGGMVNDGTLFVIAVRYTPDGRRVGTPIILTSRPFDLLSDSQHPIAASMDADGDAVVVYATKTDPADTEIYFRQISKTGEVDDAVLIAQGNIDEVSVSMDSAGGFFAGWIRPIDRVLEMRPYDATGTPRGSAFIAFDDPTLSEISDLDISARADGSGAAIAFTHYFAEPHVAFGQVSTTELDGDIGFTQGLQGNSTSHASVATLRDGSFAIGFQEFDPGNGNPTDYKAYVQRYDGAGDELGDLIALGAAAFNRGTSGAQIDSMSDGGFVAAFGQVTSGPTQTVYARRYSAQGVPDGPGPTPLARSSSNGFLTQAIGADNNGTTTVLFSQSLPGDDLLQYRRLTAQPAAIDKGMLYVFGTEADDSIDIRQRGLSIVVTRGSLVRRFDASLISQLSVSGFGEDDFIFNNTTLPSIMDGGADNDTIVGGSSRDKITGSSGQDRLYGGGGNDLVYGQDGHDVLFGGDGNDTVNGGGGVDALRGELGDDLLIANDNVIDQVFGGTGRDTADADANDEIRDVEVLL